MEGLGEDSVPPAILTGWIDRVLRPKVAYRFDEGDSGEGTPVGLLRARGAVVFNTSNTLPDREARVFGDPLERIWKDCIFGLCGVPNVERQTFGVIVTSTPAQRRAWLEQVRATVARHFPRERYTPPALACHRPPRTAPSRAPGSF
jgi:putative NADPH-quinone reductase